MTIPSKWRGSSHDHKGFYSYKMPSKTKSYRFQNRAFYNPEARVLELFLFPTAPAMINSSATRSNIKKGLGQLFGTKHYLCIVEDGRKVKNKDSYLYEVQWYCDCMDFPDEVLLDQAISIASKYILEEAE